MDSRISLTIGIILATIWAVLNPLELTIPARFMINLSLIIGVIFLCQGFSVKTLKVDLNAKHNNP